MPATELTSSAEQGYYVYGITDGAPEGLAPGVGPGAPVELLVADDLAAIVSPVPLADFTPEAVQARQDDLAWIEAQVRAHQDVLARAVQQVTVAPLRFGTVFRDAAGVYAMLHEQAARFRATLARLAGRQEWGVKITTDQARLNEWVATVSRRVQELAARQRGMSAGAAYMLTKKRDQLIREEASQAIEQCARQTHARLAALAVAAVISSPSHRGTSAGQETVFNGAYLVETSQVATFLEALDDLAATHPAFAFTVSGPWPAYHFVNPGETDAHA